MTTDEPKLVGAAVSTICSAVRYGNVGQPGHVDETLATLLNTELVDAIDVVAGVLAALTNLRDNREALLRRAV